MKIVAVCRSLYFPQSGFPTGKTFANRTMLLPTIPTIPDLGNQDVVPLDGTVTALRFRAHQVSVGFRAVLSLPVEGNRFDPQGRNTQAAPKGIWHAFCIENVIGTKYHPTLCSAGSATRVLNRRQYACLPSVLRNEYWQSWCGNNNDC